MYRIAIPARADSSRLPGKALAELHGKPMLQWVYEKVCAAGASEVLIATDAEPIASAARAFGAAVRMTSPAHASGTDRIAELAALEGWADEDIVVNVQGDEPLIPPRIIAQVVGLLAECPQAAIATLATPIELLEEFLDPNAVKVVTDRSGRALYFSRAPIPWERDGAAQGLASQRRFQGARRHVGLYAYRVAVQGPPPGTDTAIGAIAGAVLGAAVSDRWDRGSGAVFGALTGAMIGSAGDAANAQANQQAMSASAREQQRAITRQAMDYRRALSACLQGRGYSVR